MMRKYIKTGDIREIITIMAENNQDAEELLWQMEQKQPDQWLFIQWLLCMDDMNIRGNQISVIFTDFAKKDLDLFWTCIDHRDLDMIAFINSAYADQEAVPANAEREVKMQLQPHQEGIVWFYGTDWKPMFSVQSGSHIIVSDNYKKRRSAVRYLSDQFFMVEGKIMHVWQFADVIERKGYHVMPCLEEQNHPYKDFLYQPPQNKWQIKKYKKWLKSLHQTPNIVGQK